MHRRVDVDIVTQPWIGEGAWDTRERGDVKHNFDAAHGARADCRIAQVGDDELDVRGDILEIGAITGREIVDHADRVPATHQLVDQM